MACGWSRCLSSLPLWAEGLKVAVVEGRDSLHGATGVEGIRRSSTWRRLLCAAGICGVGEWALDLSLWRQRDR